MPSLSEDLNDLGAGEQTAHTRHGLFIAARRFITGNLNNRNLDALAVAYAIGCSRATLHRVFAEHQWTVASYIREQRLQSFLRILQTAGGSETITELACRCGFADGANVSKKLRQRFGMSPREVRRSST